MNDLTRQRLIANWHEVVREVADAALACGRDPAEIKIIGVSKYVDADCTRELIHAGCTDLGESRPQTLWQKAETLQLGGGVQWHLIGHLQTNKVRRLLRHQPIIHSVDSQRLLECIASESDAQNLTTRVLLEVNISGDAAKTGLNPEDAEQLLERLPGSGVRVVGLMAMAGWGTDARESRRQFEMARQLRDQWCRRHGIALEALSMGMSGDFREAVAAGSTMVRIGSRLFEGVIDEG